MNTLLENNLNIETKSINKFTDNFASDNKNGSKFIDVLNSKKENQAIKTASKSTKVVSNSTKITKTPEKPKTLGSLKNNDNGQERTKIANFKEILTKAAGEISVENALDLTLKRDIGDIINQIKDIVKSDDEDVGYEEIADVIKCNPESDKREEQQKDEDVSELLTGMVVLDNKQTNFENANQNLNLPEEDIETENSLTEKIQIKDVFKEELQEDKKEMSDLSLDSEMLEELNVEYIGAENASTGEEESSMNKQSPEEFSVKAMLNHHDSKNFELNTVASTSKAVNVQDMSPDKIIEQITKQMESMKNFSRVNIVLNPASLGRVDLQVINTKEGLSAQFTVTTNEARELLMRGLDGLKESLLAQGVGVDNVSVKIAETEETSYNEDWTEQEGSRGGNKEGGEPRKDEKEKGLFEKTIAQTLDNENGKV